MNRRTFLGVIAAAAVVPPVVKPAGPTGVTTITWASSKLEVGDVITIAGQNVFNPLTRQPTFVLQKYLVTSVSPYLLGLEPKR